MNFHFYSLLLPFYREGNGTPLQNSCLENHMDGGAWWAAVHGVAKSRTQLRDFTFTFHFHAWEKEMATHPSVLAWRTPGMGEPGGLPAVYGVAQSWTRQKQLSSSSITFLKQKTKKKNQIIFLKQIPYVFKFFVIDFVLYFLYCIFESLSSILGF